MDALALEKALNYTRTERARFLEDLKELVRIPSISGTECDPAQMERAAQWLAGYLKKVGAKEARVYPTAGSPVVFGEIHAGDGLPTVMFYGHYDVQPATPLEAWHSQPFEPLRDGDFLIGRGASDMKGQFMACINAVEAALKAGPLPLNIKFLLEGEEEIGSPSFEAFLREHSEMLACDFVFNPDAGMVAPDKPTIVYSLRGIMVCTFQISGPIKDLHSGSFGGVVENPVHVLSRLIAGLHDADGRVSLPGFYDNVRPLPAEERAELARLPLDETFYLQETGAPALWGEPGYIPVERTGARPTLEVVYFQGGAQKAAIPIQATAMISCRLVPDQTPDEIYEKLMDYLNKNMPPTVTWKVLLRRGVMPCMTDPKLPFAQKYADVLEQVWGVRPVYHRVGGGIGVVNSLQTILGIDSLLTGFELMDSNAHGPDEKLHLPTWELGMESVVRYLYKLAE
jgi:acetylornithine deacetylase/succinyl-diaminopimelate desuccinylase-like protein